MDKQKQIEEMAKYCCGGCEMSWGCDDGYCAEKGQDGYKTCGISKGIAEKLYNAGYRKITENAVVIPKEISCYDNIEKAVKTFSLDGNKVDFTQEQIMALTQIFSFKERRENEIRKETAEKFAELKTVWKQRAKEYTDWAGNKVQAVTLDLLFDDIDEICKEITGVKENGKT